LFFFFIFFFFLPLTVRRKTLGRNEFSSVRRIHVSIESLRKSFTRLVAGEGDVFNETSRSSVSRPDANSLGTLNSEEDVLGVVGNFTSGDVRTTIGSSQGEVGAVHLKTEDASCILLIDVKTAVVADELGRRTLLGFATDVTGLEGRNAVTSRSEAAGLSVSVALVADGASSRDELSRALEGSVASGGEASALRSRNVLSTDVVDDIRRAPAALRLSEAVSAVGTISHAFIVDLRIGSSNSNRLLTERLEERRNRLLLFLLLGIRTSVERELADGRINTARSKKNKGTGSTTHGGGDRGRGSGTRSTSENHFVGCGLSVLIFEETRLLRVVSEGDGEGSFNKGGLTSQDLTVGVSVLDVSFSGEVVVVFRRSEVRGDGETTPQANKIRGSVVLVMALFLTDSKAARTSFTSLSGNTRDGGGVALEERSSGGRRSLGSFRGLRRLGVRRLGSGSLSLSVLGSGGVGGRRRVLAFSFTNGLSLSTRSSGRNDFTLIGLVVAGEELADRAALSFALGLADTSTGGGRITSESLVVTFVTDLASISGEDTSAGEVVALLVDTRTVESFSVDC